MFKRNFSIWRDIKFSLSEDINSFFSFFLTFVMFWILEAFSRLFIRMKFVSVCFIVLLKRHDRRFRSRIRNPFFFFVFSNLKSWQKLQFFRFWSFFFLFGSFVCVHLFSWYETKFSEDNLWDSSFDVTSRISSGRSRVRIFQLHYLQYQQL